MDVFNSTQPQNNFDKNNYGRTLIELNNYSKQELNLRIAICVIHGILCFSALLGNAAIVITIWKTSSLRSATNILLTSLAISDLAVGLLEQPLFIAYWLTGTYSVGLLLHVSASIFCSTSFFTMTAIAVERLLALQLHLRYHSVVTRPRVIWLVSFIWIHFTSGKLGFKPILYQRHCRLCCYHLSALWKLCDLLQNQSSYPSSSKTDSTSTTRST